MFSYDDIQKYNETDMNIYRYIVSNIVKIPYMTIRELAGEVYTSPAAILRFCNKNGCQGFTEFKEILKQEMEILDTSPPLPDLQELSAFFSRANSGAFEEKLNYAVEVIRRAELVLFLGIGSSGTLARYGARCFSNFGKFSVGLEDSYYPIDTYRGGNTVLIVLSESGETKEAIEMAKQFQQKDCCLLSITNSPLSTLAKMSNWNFSYNFKPYRINGKYNGTTQVPVLFIIEALAKRI